MASPAYRTRSTGELLDAAFLMFRRHFTSIVLGAGVFLVPVSMIDLLFPSPAAGVASPAAVLAKLVSNLLYVAASAAAVLVTSEAYLGRKVELGAVLRTVLGRFGTVFWATIVRGFIVGLGLLLLVIPGVVVFLWTFSMTTAVVIEGRGADEAFDRSRNLARGEAWRILRTAVLAYLIFFAAILGAGFASGGVTYLLGLPEVVGTVLLDLAFICVFPFTAVVNTLLYYDLRIRKEGLDLELLAGELEAAPAGTVAAVAPV